MINQQFTFQSTLDILWKIHRIVQTNPSDVNYHRKPGYIILSVAMGIELVNYLYTLVVYQRDVSHKIISLAFTIIAVQVQICFY